MMKGGDRQDVAWQKNRFINDFRNFVIGSVTQSGSMVHTNSSASASCRRFPFIAWLSPQQPVLRLVLVCLSRFVSLWGGAPHSEKLGACTLETEVLFSASTRAAKSTAALRGRPEAQESMEPIMQMQERSVRCSDADVV